ncbi:hypothetical protein OG818_22435 [Streptomyces virginiae]|uniref:hypothetical protein n=1 Tax=Streptomyces virginiae TaxID=1961 RepID=UPI002251BD73|nr:hypothetical protein [Streptomyces virginiae]MCX4718522.1 hypothetical protein [Streptomyces virginiae]
MYPNPPQPPPFTPVEPARPHWPAALAVPVVVATLLLPPLGAALAFLARWGRTGRIVTVALASVWFLVLVAATSDPKPEAVAGRTARDRARTGAQLRERGA